ncbi:MAG: D-tyrosyl-tRNA(Tyr) deacylase, partial [Armatimonadetes bacterium]|nr:D-tyrosyl-tRNA(Tyr) deacylase [Armatimonadota bacterium]
EAAVEVDGREVGRIERGLLILVGCGEGDTTEDGRYLADKIANLRIFEDEAGKMNLSLLDIGGEALVVSQFTLYGDCRKGRRPSFTSALAPERADELIGEFADNLTRAGLRVAQGSFGAKMRVSLVNDGPVTILLDSEKTF